MSKLTVIDKIEGKNHIAILDTSSISFIQRLEKKNIKASSILKDYDLILIPEWVMTEILDAEGRAEYVEKLSETGYPIYRIDERSYSDLAKKEEGNLYQIVLASTYQIGRLKSYLRRFVEKDDPLNMDQYEQWIDKMYKEWPVPGRILSNGRTKKKNAGEISITILAEVVSWYYPETKTLVIYSQDSDTFDFQKKAEQRLREFFLSRTPVPVSYKSNDAILCQLFRERKMKIEDVKSYRTDMRKITYSKALTDSSVVLITELVDTDTFIGLIQDATVHIIF